MDIAIPLPTGKGFDPYAAPARDREELALNHDHGLTTLIRFSSPACGGRHGRAAAIARLAEDEVRRAGSAGRQTVQQRFNWPVVARLHHQLYTELADRRRSEEGSSDGELQHPLRSDPFQDFSPFATKCLGPEITLCLASPLSELQYRLNHLTSLDCVYEQLRATKSDLHRLLIQLHNEGPCSHNRLLSYWPAEKHDVLVLSLTWLAKLGFIHWSYPPAKP